MRFLASLNLAVILIILMALMMMAGTFFESKYGTNYARSTIYNSPFFLTVEFFLFLNILFAALVRLPPKGRLAGFYITHLGLLAVIFGGLLTMIYGIDGGIELEKGKIVSLARLQGSAIYLRHINADKTEEELKTITLPSAADEVFPKENVFLRHHKLTIERYLPRARARNKWLPTRITEWVPLPPRNDDTASPSAALLRISSKSEQAEENTLWVSDQEQSVFRSETGDVFEAALGPTFHALPFAIRLDEFLLRTDDIGSNAPSSYESFVTVFLTKDRTSKHLIAMNQPLKIGNYTFYQTSYFPSSGGSYGSVLTVNADPGRSLKYTGSFLITTGSLTHFLQRAFEKKRKVIKNVQNRSPLAPPAHIHSNASPCRG